MSLKDKKKLADSIKRIKLHSHCILSNYSHKSFYIAGIKREVANISKLVRK